MRWARSCVCDAHISSGKILDIVACRGKKLRGQAWVVFDELQPATNALRQMQGFPFFDKPMRISFARAKSDVISKRDGTFKPREKRPREEPPAPVPAAPAPGVAENGGDDGPEAKRRQTEAAAAAAAAGPSVPSNTLFAEGMGGFARREKDDKEQRMGRTEERNGAARKDLSGGLFRCVFALDGRATRC
eukprot:scaffold2952_cov312-Pinguiococcus_pyrenoidosus.AAC.4